jgi:hypothetical protein
LDIAGESTHMSYLEESDEYLQVVRCFLRKMEDMS